MRFTLLCFALASFVACKSSTPMSGSSGQKKADETKKSEDASKEPTKTKKKVAEEETPSTTMPERIEDEPVVDSVVKPDEVVDGQEVINDCGRCVERAKQLSPQAGFVAELGKTFNEGFYKVDPARGLCDIHFMADMNYPIANHEGRDSVLDRQVALYCPCTCGWAVDQSQGVFGYPSGPF